MDQSLKCEYDDDDEYEDEVEAFPTVVVKSDSEEESEDCNCIIEELLVKPFGSREYAEKFNIITNGRPTPILANMTSKTRACTRRFQMHNYKTCTWLCGCEKHIKLFCWPCILFSNEASPWTCTGISDLNNLHNLLKRHEVTVSHISAMLALKNFGRDLDESFRIDTNKLNQLVKKNRHVITKLIDVTCVLVELELPFESDYEATLRRSNFTELINLLKRYDDNLETHISNCNAFTRFSVDLQNDLIDAIYQVVLDEIKGQVSEADFIALMMEEIADVAGKCQIAYMLRYSDKNGDVHERFHGFMEFPHDPLLAPHILNMINELKVSSRLISISYNGPSFMAPKNSSLIQKIKYQYPGIYCVRYYPHKMFFILKNIVDHISECKVFFWTLMGLASFFSKSSKRNFALHQEIRKRFPTLNSIKWDINMKLVTRVSNYRVDILNVLESMVENGTKWDIDTYNCAKGFHSALKDFEFNFLLHLFSKIFPRAESLFGLLEEQNRDTEFYITGIEEFQKHLENLKNDYDDFWLLLNDSSCIDDTKVCKRIKVEDRMGTYRGLYLEVIDNLQRKISQDSLSEIENVNFTVLLDSQLFPQFMKSFPFRSFYCLKKSVYGRLFDTNKLKTELQVLYDNTSLWKTTIYEFYKFLCDNKLQEIIPEVCKLACLIVTVPVTVASKDVSFPASKRIKTFQENRRADEIPPSLALLSIEKNLLSLLRMKPHFHEEVINRFGSKIRHIELTYKS